jgi:tRNA(Ile2) C34 agmatinyltransferase TiaS
MTKQFLFSASLEHDKDVIDYLESLPKGVRSNFIREAIRAKINGDDLEAKIRKIVSEMMQKNDGGEISDIVRGFFD